MGFIHIYCGEGKGKTTASIGLAVRAAGAGKQVRFTQLMKGVPTSELASLALIPNITVTRCDKNYGFSFKMSDEDKAAITQCHNALLKESFDLVKLGKVDLLIIDEFNAAYNYNLLDREMAEELILGSEYDTEIVLTGRNPAKPFADRADYLSEIKCVKHPHNNGVHARRGIEF